MRLLPTIHLARPHVVLLRLALLVALGDLLTKQLAVYLLAGGDVVYHPLLRLTLLHNDAAAFGYSFGTHTFAMNLILKSTAVALMLAACRDLARIDPDAPHALGLIVGAALGNLGSLVLHPAGVVDFVAVHVSAGQELVFNGADLAAYAGLALLARTAWRVLAAARSPARGVIAEQLAGRPVALRLLGERQIVREVVHADSPDRNRNDLWPLPQGPLPPAIPDTAERAPAPGPEIRELYPPRPGPGPRRD